MEISRLPNNPPSIPGRAPQSTPPPEAQPADQFQPATSPPPKIGKKIWAAASLTGTVGMFVGTRWGASMGHPALGFALGTLVGGAIGAGLASFAYSGKPS
ncbi:MAG: hypothetical protein KF760_02795 [Candidatus Eremiobacteraeota bacterium]|nr:hypothetical protein [Candidatus Eremiobacteraeota bacterium]MCW5870483.1 hypothetical protein [Candidatus Eremiobacteraeota bacterium]